MIDKIYDVLLKHKKNVALAIISVLFLMFVVYFFNARINISKILDNYIQTTIAQFERQGYRISFDKISFNTMSPVIKVNMKNLKVSVLKENENWQYQTPNIKASIFILNPSVIKIKPANRQLFIIEDKKYKISSEDTELKLKFHNSYLIKEIIFAAENLAINDEYNFGEVNIASRKIAQYNVDPLSQFYEVMAKINNIDLAKSTNHPLSSNIKEISLKASILGDIGLEKARIALDEWRDIGGSIDVSELNIDWRPMKLRANGAIAIDDYFQPMLVMSTEIDGIFRTLKSFETKDIIKRKDYAVAKIVLANKVEKIGNGLKRFKGSINIQENRVYLDNILIGNLPMLGFTYNNVVPDNVEIDKDGNIIRNKYVIDPKTKKAVLY